MRKLFWKFVQMILDPGRGPFRARSIDSIERENCCTNGRKSFDSLSIGPELGMKSSEEEFPGKRFLERFHASQNSELQSQTHRPSMAYPLKLAAHGNFTSAVHIFPECYFCRGKPFPCRHSTLQKIGTTSEPFASRGNFENS